MASKRLRDTVRIDPNRIVTAALQAALGEIEAPEKKQRHPGRVLVAGAALAAAAAAGQKRLPRIAKLPLKMGLHKLGDLTHVDDLADALHDRADALHDRLVGDDEDYEEDGEEFDEEGEEFDEDDEPIDEADEDFDDEDGEDFDDGPDDDEPEDDEGPDDEGDEEEPEAEGDEDLDDEPGDEPLEDEELEEEEPEDLDDEDLPPEDDEDDEEEVAARGLDLGLSSDRGTGIDRDRVPDLFEALRLRPVPAMPPVSRRIDPATRPPEPDGGRQREERPRSSRKSKPKAARA